MAYIRQQEFETTSFNEIEAVQPIPYIEGSATYDLISANFREFTDNGGTTGADNRLFNVSTGTTSGGYAAIQSFRSVPHRVGKGVSARFSGYFDTSVANSWQGIGMISIGEEISFGYDGADFGVWHRYGGLSEVRTITVTGAAGANTDLTLTLNSVAYTIPLTTGTVEHNAYEIAQWLNDNQSVWGADQLDDTVIINALSDGAKSGTYTYSHATSTGTITQNTAGVTKTSEHIAQSSWNGNVFDGFDPSNGNLYEIRYQNQGFGNIQFSIMNPDTNRYDTVHTIKWVNSTTTVGVPNPSLRAGMYAVSLGSTVRVRAINDVGQEQNFTNVGNNLVSDYDSTSFTFTGGRLLVAQALGPTDSITINLQELEISQPPSLNLLITVQRVATGGATTEFTATNTWYEDL